jgi:hypothetical protein
MREPPGLRASFNLGILSRFPAFTLGTNGLALFIAPRFFRVFLTLGRAKDGVRRCR